MPCRDARPSEGEEREMNRNQDLERKVDDLTRMLCSVMKVHYVLKPVGLTWTDMPEDARRWFTQHLSSLGHCP